MRTEEKRRADTRIVDKIRGEKRREYQRRVKWQ